MSEKRNGPGRLGELAAWAAAVRYEDIPPRVVEKARLQILNVLASIHAGTVNGQAMAAARAVVYRKIPGPSTVFPTGEKTTAEEAVFANGALAMALDYDDYLFMGHTGHSAVLVSLALAEETGASMRDLLTAQVAANELAGRLGASVLVGPHNGQLWAYIHLVGAAAAAGRLLGLDHERMAHALAVSLYQPVFPLYPGFMGPGSKVLTAAAPSVTGIRAARFAAEGLTGPLNVLDDDKGFFRYFSYRPLPYMLTGLGRSWVTDTLSYKPYPGCAYVDTTLDALLEILGRYKKEHSAPLDPREVERVEVEASILTVEMDNLSAAHRPSGRLAPINVNFSIPLNVAVALVAGRHSAEELSDRWLGEHEKEVRDLCARVNLRHDWKFTTRMADAVNSAFGGQDPIGHLRIGDLTRVRKELKGSRGGTPLRLGRFFKDTEPEERGFLTGDVWGRLKGLAGLSRPAPFDLGQVDFDKFRFPFGARVTLATRDGEILSAEQAIPFGASGSGRYLEIPAEKYHAEAARRQGKAARERLVKLVGEAESHPLSEIVEAALAS